MRTGSARAVFGVLILAAWVGQHTDAGAPATEDTGIKLAWSANLADGDDGIAESASTSTDHASILDCDPANASGSGESGESDEAGTFACTYRITAYCDRGITAA